MNSGLSLGRAIGFIGNIFLVESACSIVKIDPSFLQTKTEKILLEVFKKIKHHFFCHENKEAYKSFKLKENRLSLGKIQFIRHHFKSGKRFISNPDVATVVGEGPAGLQAVLSLLDKAKANPEETAKKIIWYKARNERVRRHIVTILDKTSSIRAVENSLQIQIDGHEMRHLLLEKMEKFDPVNSVAGKGKHVFLADGFNSMSRNSIFFNGVFQRPETSLVERCIVCYTGLQPIDGKPEADTGTKTPISLDMLKGLGIKQPEQFVDLLKLSFTGMINSNKKKRIKDTSIEKFDPYLNGFTNIENFKSQGEKGIEEFFNQHATPDELKPALVNFEFSDDDIDKYSTPEYRKSLFDEFKRNVEKFANAVKSEKGEIIFVPVFRKHTYFGMKGLSAKDDDTGQTFHLIGDAALGFAPGGPNITEAMQYSRKIVKSMMHAEFKNKEIKNLDRQGSSLNQEQWSTLAYTEWNEKKGLLSPLPSTSSIQ